MLLRWLHSDRARNHPARSPQAQRARGTCLNGLITAAEPRVQASLTVGLPEGSRPICRVLLPLPNESLQDAGREIGDLLLSARNAVRCARAWRSVCPQMAIPPRHQGDIGGTDGGHGGGRDAALFASAVRKRHDRVRPPRPKSRRCSAPRRRRPSGSCARAGSGCCGWRETRTHGGHGARCRFRREAAPRVDLIERTEARVIVAPPVHRPVVGVSRGLCQGSLARPSTARPPKMRAARGSPSQQP